MHKQTIQFTYAKLLESSAISEDPKLNNLQKSELIASSLKPLEIVAGDIIKDCKVLCYLMVCLSLRTLSHKNSLKVDFATSAISTVYRLIRAFTVYISP